MDKTEVVTEVPEALKTLVKKVMRGFYSREVTLIMELLLRNACMKEDDIVELLKFDKKQMGVSIKGLKMDQFIKTRMKVESDADGKTSRHNYYFINYTGFVNVCKYKLDHVRRKLEVQERDSTSRASFKCNSCMKQYTDLEADHLFDMNTGTFNCMMCGNEMEEQQSAAPVKDARALIQKFNEQIQPLYDLLRECDKYKLHYTLLEPAPIDIKDLGVEKKSSDRTRPSASADGPRTWSGEATKGTSFGAQSNTVDVKIGDDAIEKRAPEAKKEQPAWMAKSTISGVDTALYPSQAEVKKAEPEVVATTTTDTNIMHTLLVHENKAAVAAAPALAASDKSDESDLEEVDAAGGAVEEMEESEEEEVMVMVAGRKVPFHEAQAMVDQMTETEKDLYNRTARQMISDMDF